VKKRKHGGGPGKKKKRGASKPKVSQLYNGGMGPSPRRHKKKKKFKREVEYILSEGVGGGGVLMGEGDRT